MRGTSNSLDRPVDNRKTCTIADVHAGASYYYKIKIHFTCNYCIYIFIILSRAKKGFGTKFATKDQLEETAQLCEKFTEIFPVLFPMNHITRKMHVLSIVAPRQIREQGCVYKMMKIEQQGEKLHKQLNDKDKQFANIKNKSQRFFYMLRELENGYYV